MDRLLKHSGARFVSAMSSIVEKYNFPFEDDMIVSMKSLTYNTSDGPKVWGEESSTEIIDSSYQNSEWCQEHTGRQHTSDFENDDFEDNQLHEEEGFMKSCEENHLDTDQKNNTELASLKRHLESIHIKENCLPLWSYGRSANRKFKIYPTDILLENSTSFAPESVKVERTKVMTVCQQPSVYKIEDESLFGHRGVIHGKQDVSVNECSASALLLLTKSVPPSSATGTILSGNHSVWNNSETGYSSFLEMYESADEQCSWNNVTIADLYPGMVKALSRLMHRMSHRTLSTSFIKRYRRAYWHPKKTKVNGCTEKIKKSRSLKLKSGLVIVQDDLKRQRWFVAKIGSNGYAADSKHKANASGIGASIYPSIDKIAGDVSGIVEDNASMDKDRQNDTETIFPLGNLCTEETFLVENPSCLPSSSDCRRMNETFEENIPITSSVEEGGAFNVAAEDKAEEMSTVMFKATSLNLSFKSHTTPHLQNDKFAPVKVSNMLLKNNEIKKRSHSFSSFPVNQSPTKAHKKFEDAFEKLYNELCAPQLQKTTKFSNLCRSPRKSTELHVSSFSSLSSKFHQNHKAMVECAYQKLYSEGFPPTPTFLRALSLKKYEGIQISETVNALVNSPVRTLPAVSRIKRTANFFNEDTHSSPIKRLKNTSENSYRIYHKLPYWKNSPRKTDTTFTLFAQDADSWASKMVPRFGVSSDPNFLTAPSLYTDKSGFADMDESVSGSFQSCNSSRKSKVCPF